MITWTLAVGDFPRVLPGVEVWDAWTYGFVGALLLFVSVLLSLEDITHVLALHGLGHEAVAAAAVAGTSHRPKPLRRVA